MTEAEQLFEQVYRTYGPSLYRFCLIQMKNPADAEDILQEVFCKRLYRAPVFASPDHERRWLFRVALNQCRDAWKRSNRSELPLEAASAAVTPEELGLLDHVAALPESQRTVLHLHYYEGYTLREIARLLGVTVPTVKMRLKRGRDAPKGLVAVLLVVLTYGTIGLLLALAGIRITATITSLVQQIPSLYSAYILPELTDFFAWLEELLAKLDPSLMSALQELQSQLLNMLWQLVSSLSVVLVGGVSIATSFATSLPGFLIRLLLMVISTFFIAVDYQKIVRFCLGCLQGSTRNLVLQVKAYVVGTLFVCIRSYALIMSITFVELSVGLTLIGVNRAILVALLIAIFDILPVLGTGGIMIPWVILSALGGDLPHAFALLVLYVIITVIRNIIEPRIVGAQIGLHPVLTLMSMFVGNHLFGIVGLFGLPILLSLLRYLNDNGTISLFPASALGRADTETSQ